MSGMAQVQWRTLREMSSILRVSQSTILRLIAEDKIYALRTAGSTKISTWRILDPTEKLQDYCNALNDHLSFTPILNVKEVAEILQIKRNSVGFLVRKNRLQAETRGGKYFFTVNSLREYLNRQARSGNKKKRVVMSAVILRWATARLKPSEPLRPKSGDAEFGRMLEQIVALKEPSRTIQLRKLWKACSDIGLLMKVRELDKP